MNNSISFIVLTQFFHGYLIFKLNLQYFFSVNNLVSLINAF